MIGLREKLSSGTKPGAECLASVGAAELPLQCVAYERNGLADNPATDRLVETLASPPMRIIAGQMPCDLGRSGRCLTALRAGVDQTLMHAAATGREERELRRVPEVGAEKIDALILSSALGCAQCLPRESDQSLWVRCVIAHRGTPSGRRHFDDFGVYHLGLIRAAYLVGRLKTFESVETVAAEQFDQLGAWGVERAQGAKLLKQIPDRGRGSGV